jgi:predicted Fe-Mo cluster-binding NifX family protein/DNA-directed RNA polymerase subunit RPC12/RpoP
MSVAQLIPDADGIVIVTSPQDVALLDSRKCVSFVREVNHRVLGIIENLSGLACPQCGHQIDLFKKGGGEKAALELGVPFLGRIPIAPQMVESGDRGKPLVGANPNNPAALVLTEIARTIQDNWSNGGQVVAARSDGAQDQTSSRSTVQIAVAADDDKGLDGQVSTHFGRCPYYVIAEVEDGKIAGLRTEKNSHFGNHQPGQMPVFIRNLGANVILAGGMGPGAVEMFHSFGIEVATGAVGNVGKVLDAYLRGEIKGIVPCEHDHPESCVNH